MAQYIIKTLPKYAKPGLEDLAANRPYLCGIGWADCQCDALRFESVAEALNYLDRFYPRYRSLYGARVMRLKPRKK